MRAVVSNHGYVCAVVSNHVYLCARWSVTMDMRAQWSVTMDMHESYNKLVIARAVRMPHVGYWHGSDVKSRACGPWALRQCGPRALRQCGQRALRHYRANNLRVALETVQ